MGVTTVTATSSAQRRTSQLRALRLAARAQGLSFDEAWPDARKAALRVTYGKQEWACRFDEDKDALWRAAFERRQLAVAGDLSLLIEGRERDTPVLAEMTSDVLAEAAA